MAVDPAHLKDILEEALVHYLHHTHRTHENRSTKFGYDSDSSNLRIWLLDPSDLDFVVTEVSVMSVKYSQRADCCTEGIPAINLL